MGHTATTDRLGVWRDVIREHFVALDIDARDDESFAGHVTSCDLGPLNVASVRSAPQVFTRTSGLARRDDDAYLQVGLVNRGSGVVEQDGRQTRLAPGDFAVYETGRPFRWALRDDWELLVFTWPRAVVGVSEAQARTLTAHRLGGDGLGAVVGAMLRDLALTAPTVSTDGGVRLSLEVSELVATVALEQVAADASERGGESLLRRIDDYVAERIGDPGLDPTDIAAAHFVSTRHLHRLFAARGTTVSQHIRRLRLERAAVQLRHPAYRHRTITEVARDCGFADLASFSRAFRAAHRTTPSRYRSPTTEHG